MKLMDENKAELRADVDAYLQQYKELEVRVYLCVVSARAFLHIMLLGWL